MYAPDATPATAAAAVPEVTSAKLTALKADVITKGNTLQGLTVGSTDWNSAMLEVFKAQKLVEGEISAIKSAESAAKLQAARDAKIASVVGYRDAVLADAKLQISKATADEKTASTDSLTKLQDELVNAIMGSLRSSVKPAGDKTAGTGGKGETTRKIRAIFDEMRAVNPQATQNEIATEVKARGFARGTSDSAILAYMRELGEKS